MDGKVTNGLWERERFDEVRESLFREQLAGAPYDLDEAVSFARENADRSSVSKVLRAARDVGDMCVVPRSGVANWDGQVSLMRKLDLAGADFLSVTVDSLTRDLRFAEAASELAKSTELSSKLNGYPIVAHGVDANRRLVQTFTKPVIVRANSPDLRIVAETAFASGATGFVSGPMYATLEYSKKTTLTESIPYWQYVFRLIGEYTSRGVPIADDAIGFAQSGTCSVPSLMHVGVVLDALIMAAQGVRHIMVYSMLQGHLAQDIASCFAVDQLTRFYLDRFGYQDVETYVASSDWNGAFPERHPDAYGLIASNVVAAAIAGAPLNYVKTIDEGRGVPTAESNADSIRFTKYLARLIGLQRSTLRFPAVDAELELNLLEAHGMIDAILDIGDGDPAVGSIRALGTGLLDIPFSPNIHVKGDVLPVRDSTGAVRFLDSGGLAIPAAAKKIRSDRLKARESQEGLGYDAVIADLQFFEMDVRRPAGASK